MKSVRVGTMNSAVKEVIIEDGGTVGDALTAANISLGDREVRVQGDTVDTSHVPQEGDLIFLASPVKAG